MQLVKEVREGGGVGVGLRLRVLISHPPLASVSRSSTTSVHLGSVLSALPAGGVHSQGSAQRDSLEGGYVGGKVEVKEPPGFINFGPYWVSTHQPT